MTLPHLDSHFRDPSTGKLKQNVVFVVDNVVDMPRSPLVGLLLVRLQRHLRYHLQNTIASETLLNTCTLPKRENLQTMPFAQT